MKKIFHILLLSSLLVACGPSRHTMSVEMRNPSKSGMDLQGKSLAIVCLDNGKSLETGFAEGIADGLASALEADYETGEGSVGIFQMMVEPGVDYSARDTLLSLMMDTGSDVIFLIDTVSFGASVLQGTEKVSYPSVADSSYVTTAAVPFSVKMYCYDSMNRNDKVFTFKGNSTAVPFAYSDGKQPQSVVNERLLSSYPAVGKEAGAIISSSFRSQWKTEQFSIVYFDSDKWYTAARYAEDFQWKKAVGIWMELVGSNDPLKRSCAAYNIATACYISGDYDLTGEWMSLSDSTERLSFADALRKRIEIKKSEVR